MNFDTAQPGDLPSQLFANHLPYPNVKYLAVCLFHSISRLKQYKCLMYQDTYLFPRFSRDGYTLIKILYANFQ